MGKKAKIALLILLIGLGVLIFYAVKYFNFVKEYASTNAMFIKSNKISNVSFKRVGGKIIRVYKMAGDAVKKGDLLAELDPTDFKVKLEGLQKKLEGLNDKKEQLDIQINRVSKQLEIKKRMAEKEKEIISKEIKSVRFAIKELDANIAQLEKDYKRFKTLYEEKAVAKRKFEEIETKLKVLKEKKKGLLAKLQGLEKRKDVASSKIKLVLEDKKRIEELKKGRASLIKEIEALEKNIEDVRNLISYCKLYSPFDGIIGKKFAEEGMVIDTGYPVYSIVDNKDLYVEVLLEETKMRGVAPGAKAEFKVDAYPDEKFEGVVEKVYPASAATYALVPRDISAGEFTKVAQRIPVKVKITEGKTELLKVGMGGEIKIKRVDTEE